MYIRQTAKFVGAVVTGFILLASTPILASIVGDDFNDNVKNTAKWGGDILFGTGVSLQETNGRLQFGGNGYEGIVRPWTYSYGSYTSNWEVAADVHLGNLTLNQNEELEMLLIVAPRGGDLFNNHFLVSLSFGLNSFGYWRYYASEMMANGIDTGETGVDTTDLQGRVSITFDATTKVLAAYYNGNPLGSHVVDSSWGTTGFQVALGGSFGRYENDTSFNMTYSGSDVYADNFALTDTSISPADELAIRNAFAAAMSAYNAKNSALFAARISDAYLHNGVTKTSLVASLLSPDWQSMSYTMDTPLYAGEGLVTALIHWNTGEIELLTFRKEGTAWLLYGNQLKYGVDFLTNHNGNNYSMSLSVEDSYSTIRSVDVVGPGLTNTISLNYQSDGVDEWAYWVSWSVGGATSNLFPRFTFTERPAIGSVYTLTIHEKSGATVTQTSRITGYVENFATDLLPVAGSTITSPQPTFSWGEGGFASKLQLFMIPSGDIHEFVWESDEPAISPLTYNGPELQSNTNYCLHFDLMDDFGNSSEISARFLYMGGGATEIPNWQDDRNTSWTGGIITTPQQLAQFAYLVSAGTMFTGQTVQLANNINLAGKVWTPIGRINFSELGDPLPAPFAGTFEGNGKTIVGLSISNSNAYAQGLFAINAGTIQNLVVSNVTIHVGAAYANPDKASNSVGVLAGGNAGLIKGCTVYGRINYQVVDDPGADIYSDVGGVAGANLGVGFSAQGSLKGCTNYVTIVSTASTTGGITGWNEADATVDNCMNFGSVTSSGETSGGVAASNEGTLQNCGNAGTIRSLGYTANYDAEVSGVVGWNGSGVVRNCFNTGTVLAPGAGTFFVAGLAGMNETTVGGAIGRLENSYSAGTVSRDSGSDVYGICAWVEMTCVISNCYWLVGSAANGVTTGGIVSNCDSFNGLPDVKFADQSKLLDALNVWVRKNKATIPSLMWWKMAGAYPSLTVVEPPAPIIQVTFDADGGTPSSQVTSQTYDSKAVLPTQPTRTGYTFGGWWTARNGEGEEITTAITVDTLAPVTLYAKWLVKTYAVRFNSNTGTGSMANQNFTYNVSQSLTPNSFAKTGYSFNGWATSASGPLQYVDQQTVSNLTAVAGATFDLYARWLPHTYAVDYVAVSATGGTVPASQAKTNDVSLTLRTNTGNLVRTGYTFGGWNTTADGLGRSYAAGGAYTNNAAVTLYSTWIPNTYAITYSANSATGGTIPAAQTKTNDAVLLLRTNSGNLVRTGYTFGGWNTAANGSGTGYAVGADYLENSAATLYAKWTLNTYAITYNANSATSGGVPSGQLKTHDIALTLSGNTGNLARVGYRFSGWNTATNGTGTSYATNASYTVNATLALYAKWTTNTYTVAYNGNGSTGGTTTNSAHTYNLPASLTANGYTRTGYSYAGWGTNSLGEVVFTNRQAVVNLTAIQGATFTLYASWTGNVYTVTFDANGGVLGTSNVMASYGAPMPAALAPAYQGFVFTGYFTASTGGTQYYDATMKSLLNWDKMVATTLYAQWTVLQMTTTTVPVPFTWLDQYPGLLSAHGGDHNAAANAIGANGYRVWESYVAGLNPTDPLDRFQANIVFSNGLMHITWSPDVSAGRKYTIEGKTNLNDSAWYSPTNSGSQFFKVKVEMP